MRTIKYLPFKMLLLLLAIAHGQQAAMPQDIQKMVSEWRAANLPATEPERYWANLKDLGSKVGEANAKVIEKTGASDIDSAVAWMAYHVWKNPEKAEELRAWYGRFVNEVPREKWEAMSKRLEDQGFSQREIHSQLAHGWSPSMRSKAPVMRLIVSQHASPEFLPAWQAWVLAPQRGVIRQRMAEASSRIGDERTIALFVEKYRIMPEQVNASSLSPDQIKSMHQEMSEIRRIISEIGGGRAVTSLLECARLAEGHGEFGEGVDNIHKDFVHGLSRTFGKEYIEKMEAQFPDFHKAYGDPDRPGRYLPVDDKWKEFKPIIEAMLKDPDALRAGDIRLLEDALAAMPKE